ncbi:MAG: DEAD/DEAH box helicase [Thermoanaerobaculia bacterium]
MSESLTVVEAKLQQAVAPGYRARLVDRGLARGLVWVDGELPDGAPAFRTSLTADLLDYGYAVLGMALRARQAGGNEELLERAFLVAGEAIEAAVHRGNPSSRDRGLNRVSGSVAFHLAGYAARAYSVLPNAVDRENLAASERGLVHLLRRDLDELHQECGRWLLEPTHTDAGIALRLAEGTVYGGDEAVSDVLTSAFFRAVALLQGALQKGEVALAESAIERFRVGGDAALDLRSVSHWRVFSLARELAKNLWAASLHVRVPVLDEDSDESRRWNQLRLNFIQRLHSQSRAAVDLWPSQFEAAGRATSQTDTLVVGLPTGAGKTRIAELCILRALASGLRAIYVTPLRALSSQVERDLSSTFLPLGIEVSALYGSAGVMSSDEAVLRSSRVVVSTPEKLDFVLRNSPSVLEDVGLVVLDEGHMLGPSEREVRYEALVQRLLRRADAKARRLVCLSAMFPAPEEMEDLVAWIRGDVPGSAVCSSWRPTRQRFGSLTWLGESARLEVQVGDERPFVQNFVRAEKPPPGSGRRKRFPAEKNELTLASAWKFVGQGKATLVFCSMRRSVEAFGKLIVDCADRGLLQSLLPMEAQISAAVAVGEEWLGKGHPAVSCLNLGVVLHHGGLPRPYLSAVEELLRKGAAPLIIASPTLAQGLNLPATVVLVPSLWRSGQPIPGAELANVAGRAGRPFVDLEGLVLHVNWEKKQPLQRRRSAEWKALLLEARAPALRSGILVLAMSIMKRVAEQAGVPVEEVLQYLTGGQDLWERLDQIEMGPPGEEQEWTSDVASLDTALLALLEADTDPAAIGAALDEALGGSLFSRQLDREEVSKQPLVRDFLRGRAEAIWRATSLGQRRGYFAAGVGFATGRALDDESERLVRALARAEVAIDEGEAVAAADAVLDFAEIAFSIPPFGTRETDECDWRPSLKAWILGQPSSEVLGLGGPRAVHLLQDAFTYRLPWAMEAARVHGAAIGREVADLLKGRAALAAEVGSIVPSVAVLVRAGFSSREGATAAVASTGATFENRSGLTGWLQSIAKDEISDQEGWPTAGSRLEWLRFVATLAAGGGGMWERRTEYLSANWEGAAAAPGTSLVLWQLPGGEVQILDHEWTPLGALSGKLSYAARWIVGAKGSTDPASVEVQFFGPLD